MFFGCICSLLVNVVGQLSNQPDLVTITSELQLCPSVWEKLLTQSFCGDVMSSRLSV